MNIGTAIKKLRKEKNISQGELAEVCNISQTSLSQIETGVKRPSAKNLEKICKSLDVPETIIYLLGLEESDVSNNKKKLFNLLYPNIENMVKQLIA